MRVALALVLVVLSGCSAARMGNYEARLKGHDGTDYQVFNQRGALLRFELPDGTKIIADDRGHPESPGLIKDVLTIWAVGKAAE